MSDNTRENAFDVALGFRLKKVRQMRRISQEALAEMLGITFQQVQKYEGGVNRMPPERIQRCAQIFEVPIGYFFGSSGLDALSSMDKRTVTLASAIAALPTEDLRKHVYNLVMSIASTCNAPDDAEAEAKRHVA